MNKSDQKIGSTFVSDGPLIGSCAGLCIAVGYVFLANEFSSVLLLFLITAGTASIGGLVGWFIASRRSGYGRQTFLNAFARTLLVAFAILISLSIPSSFIPHFMRKTQTLDQTLITDFGQESAEQVAAATAKKLIEVTFKELLDKAKEAWRFSKEQLDKTSKEFNSKKAACDDIVVKLTELLESATKRNRPDVSKVLKLELTKINASFDILAPVLKLIGEDATFIAERDKEIASDKFAQFGDASASNELLKYCDKIKADFFQIQAHIPALGKMLEYLTDRQKYYELLINKEVPYKESKELEPPLLRPEAPAESPTEAKKGDDKKDDKQNAWEDIWDWAFGKERYEARGADLLYKVADGKATPEEAISAADKYAKPTKSAEELIEWLINLEGAARKSREDKAWTTEQYDEFAKVVAGEINQRLVPNDDVTAIVTRVREIWAKGNDRPFLVKPNPIKMVGELLTHDQFASQSQRTSLKTALLLLSMELKNNEVFRIYWTEQYSQVPILEQ